MPGCVRAWELERKKFKDDLAAKNRKKTPAQIHDAIRRRNRTPKGKQWTA